MRAIGRVHTRTLIACLRLRRVGKHCVLTLSFPSKFAEHLDAFVYVRRWVFHPRQVLPFLSRLDPSCIGVSRIETRARYFEYAFSTFFVARYITVAQPPQDLVAMYIPLDPLIMHH